MGNLKMRTTAKENKLFFILFLVMNLCIEIQCSSHVAEICGRGQGDKVPESPEEIIEETKAEENEDNAGKGKYFFQGDIRLTPTQKKNLAEKKKTGKRDVTALPNEKWTQPQNIKYVLDNSLTNEAKTAIKAAIRDLQKYTCLRFFPRNDLSIHYIKFIHEVGCWSYVGRLTKEDLDEGLEQEISIGDRCQYKGPVLHEIMHTLGFHHEHSRIDRDNYVKILEKNIKEENLRDFILEANQKNLGVAYDYNSVMHYQLDAFSKDESLRTIEVIGDARGANIGHRDGMSAKDIEQIRIHYGCRSAKRRSSVLKNKTSSQIWKRFAAGGNVNSKTDDTNGGACQLYAKQESSE